MFQDGSDTAVSPTMNETRGTRLRLPARRVPGFTQKTPLPSLRGSAPPFSTHEAPISLSSETSAERPTGAYNPANVRKERPRAPGSSLPASTTIPRWHVARRARAKTSLRPSGPNLQGTGPDGQENPRTERRTPVTVRVRFPHNDFKFFSHSFQIAFHLSFTVLLRYRSCHNI